MRVKPSLIILTLKRNDGAVRKTARELGISPGTVINWRRRAKSSSRAINNVSELTSRVYRKSTRPKTTRSTTISAAAQDSIIALRKESGYGAGKIKYLLSTERSIPTIHRFLKKRGLTAETKNYRRPRYQTTTHMYLRNVDRPGKLQLDVKYVTPELSGLAHTTYLYAVIDIYSRWKAGVILPSLDQALVIEALRYIVPRLPEQLQDLLDFIQTDNGLEFQERFKDFITNESKLKKEAHLRNSISHHYIHKSSPNENAVIERSFRTDEEEFFWRINRPKDLVELNALYQQYMDKYNTYRPHMGLDYLTPEEKLARYVIVG